MGAELAGEAEDMDCNKKLAWNSILSRPSTAEWRYRDNICRIHAAHRRLASLVHPDHSGSTYFLKKVDQAKDTLLRPAREWPRLSSG